MKVFFRSSFVVALFVLMNLPTLHAQNFADLENIYSDAMQLARDGKTWEAEQAMVKATQSVSDNFGEESFEHAMFLNKLSTVYTRLNRVNLAAETLARAIEIPADTDPHTKSRLTMIMNYADLMAMQRQAGKAEQFLRDALEERAEFYGKEHSGYAYGLESLAKNLIMTGKQGEAGKLCAEALVIEMTNGNSHMADVVGTCAFSNVANFPKMDPITPWSNLTPKLRSRTISYVLALGPMMKPEHSYKVLKAIHARLEKEPTENEVDWARVLISMSNSADEADMPKERLAALELAVEELPPGDTNIVDVYNAMTVAYGNLGMEEKIQPTFDLAVAYAKKFNLTSELVDTLLNYGQWAANAGQPELADTIFQRAFASMETCSEFEKGTAYCYYGIFLHHADRYEDATKHLERALELLPAAHSYTFTARTHLPFAKQGKPCECGESGGETAAEMLTELVKKKLPEGLLDKLVNNEAGAIEVKLNRKPTDEEAEVLRRAIMHASRELRKDE